MFNLQLVSLDIESHKNLDFSLLNFKLFNPIQFY